MHHSESDERPAKVFISHSSEDKAFAKALLNLLKAIGIEKRESITCTSEGGYGIKVGRDWDKELKRCFTDYRVYVIIIHSSHLYTSPVSLNEMGAAWVQECPIFSFLVKGFMESSMEGVLTGSHQGVLVGRKDITPDLDQLKNDLVQLFGIETLSEKEWAEARADFIKTIEALPADKGAVKEQFDIDLSEHIHTRKMQFFNEPQITEEKVIKWADILKAVDSALRSPHTEFAIYDALENAYPGILEDDKKAIVDKLHHFGLAETNTITTDYEGISVVWSYSEKGRDAYERAQNYHLQLIYHERDKAQVAELMNYFSTYAMDEYLKEGPYYISDILLNSSDAWESIIHASAFQIFNPTLLEVLKPFYELFFQMTGHGECYEPTNGDKYRLVQSMFGVVNKHNEETIKWLQDNMSELANRYNALIQHIKFHFPDIILKETSTQFEKDCKSVVKFGD